MNATTTTTATAAQFAPAQVGNGRTVHLTDAEGAETLCGRTVTRFLSTEQAEKKNKPCKECAQAAEERTTEPTAEVEPEQEAAPTAPARYAPAQVGNGRTVHLTDGEAFSMDTLCGRTVSRVLTAEEAVEKGKACAKCARIVEQPADEPAEVEPVAVEEPAAEEAPAPCPGCGAEAGEPCKDPLLDLLAEVDEAPAAEEEEPAGQVKVTAYTAAREQLFLNGQENEDRALYVDADALEEALPTLRRMPRWNAAQERFTINKVALIIVSDAQGDRVWVRGEGEPIRVNLEGAQVDADAPAETGPVDKAAVLAATRLLRRRREVQRVIENRQAARAASSKA
jgi:hypothetical protein